MTVSIVGATSIHDASVVGSAIASSGFAEQIAEVLEDGSDGVARLAAAWAQARGLRHVAVDAAWRKYGKAAGPLRHATMARASEAFIAIPDGDADPLTLSAIGAAARLGVPVFVYEGARQTRSANDGEAGVTPK